MLSNDEITRMRSAAALAMTGSGVISRPTRTNDGAGGVTAAYNAVATVDVRVDPATESEAVRLYAGRIGERQAFLLNFPAGTDVVEDDRVTIGGTIYEVLGVLSGTWEIVRQCVAVRQEA